jgi:hypothetical protein
MVKEIPEITQVHASTGMEGGGGMGGGASPSFPGETTEDEDGADDEGPQAPF